MKLMYKTFTAGMVGITIVALVLAATTNSVSAIQYMQSQHGNPQGVANMMEQLHDGKNMTLGFRLGLTVTPMLCMSINGNMSEKPMISSMMARSMNQSGVMMSGQGNQSMAGLRTIMKHSNIIHVCFSISDATLLRSIMMHVGIIGSNTTKAAGNATAANTTKAAGNATAANTTKAAGNATAAAAANTTKAAGNNKGSILDPITGLGQAIANGLKGLGNLITGNKK